MAAKGVWGSPQIYKYEREREYDLEQTTNFRSANFDILISIFIFY